MATATSYGGLEHQNSTSLITPRDDLPKFDEPEQPSTNYRRFLGLCSHEYFHSWLVKFIRPHNYVVPNLHQEDYTSLLWVFEGITSYYDDLILLRSGVIDEAAYLELLKEQISRYLANPDGIYKVWLNRALMRGLNIIVLMKIVITQALVITIRARYWLCA